MKPNFATQKIVLQRVSKIEANKKALSKFQENVKNLEIIIKEDQEYLNIYKKLLENKS